MTVASESMLWWNHQDPDQATLWGSWVEISKKFFAAITAHPIPLDMRALKALKRSPLALDLYSWLTYEAFRAHKSGKGRFVAWTLLMRQMGDGYADPKEFARSSREALRKIQALYPALKLGSLRGGIRVEPESLPAITPQAAATWSRKSPIYETPPEAIIEIARGIIERVPGRQTITLYDPTGNTELLDKVRQLLKDAGISVT
jgi:replication initiator protein